MHMTQDIYFAGGCFWGVEAAFRKLLDEGVVATEVGYANGPTDGVTYRDVAYKKSGHAEVVKVTYNPDNITLQRLVALFFMVHDPTSKNQQGNDIGIQYRSGIYTPDQNQIASIDAMVERLVSLKQYPRPVVTEVQLLENYTPAEEEHQRYLDKNPSGYCHVNLDEVDEHIASMSQ